MPHYHIEVSAPFLRRSVMQLTFTARIVRLFAVGVFLVGAWCESGSESNAAGTVKISKIEPTALFPKDEGR